MNYLSAWSVSSKGLIFARIFPDEDHKIHAKALANILSTQDFDIMPLVDQKAQTDSRTKKTTPGPIIGAAVLSDCKTDVTEVDISSCTYIPKETNLISAIINVLNNRFKFVFVGQNIEAAVAIITPSMLLNQNVRNQLIMPIFPILSLYV